MICASSSNVDLVMKASGQQRKSQGEDVRFQSLVQSVVNSHDIHLQVSIILMGKERSNVLKYRIWHVVL